MIKTGITGQSGFMGYHLFQYLRLKKEDIELIPFDDSFFKDSEKLQAFVASCDVVVHLAAMNRHGDPRVIYDTNVGLVKQLLAAADNTGCKPMFVFSSSTQEERDNPYGKSKKEGRGLFIEWSEKNNTPFTGLVIPNVFGPFGNPYYNSVIATFSHQLNHGEVPKIEIDAPVRFIYINNLVEVFYQAITGKISGTEHKVDHIAEWKVTDILNKLHEFKDVYISQHIIPVLKDQFELALFNTFRGYIDYDNIPFLLKLNKDNRGGLFEVIKSNTAGQAFFSYTRPGITRGNHFHRRKIERFIVVQGEAIIRLRRIGTDKVYEYSVSGENPCAIDIPVHHTHNITNTGNTDLLTMFWSHEFFDPEDSDTYFEEVQDNQ